MLFNKKWRFFRLVIFALVTTALFLSCSPKYVHDSHPSLTLDEETLASEILKPRLNSKIIIPLLEKTVSSAIASKDLSHISLAEMNLLEILKRDIPETIPVGSLVWKILYYYEQSFAKQHFHGFYGRLESYVFSRPPPSFKKDIGFSNLIELSVRLLNYYLIEDHMDYKTRSLLERDALFKKYAGLDESNYYRHLMVRAKTFTVIGDFEKAALALKAFNIKSSSPAEITRNCTYFVEKANLSLRQKKLAPAKKQLDQLLFSLPEVDDHNNCRFWAEHLKSLVLLYEKNFTEALALVEKNSKRSTGYDVERPQVIRSRILRQSHQAKEAVRSFDTIKERTFSSVWTMCLIYVLGDKMISSIYAQDVGSFSDASNKILPLLLGRKHIVTHDPITWAWLLIGRHSLLKEPLASQEIEESIRKVAPIIGSTHPDVLELQNFYFNIKK